MVVIIHKKTDTDYVILQRGAFEENYRKLLEFAYILPNAESASIDEVKDVEGEVKKLVPRYEIISKWGDMCADVRPGFYRSAVLLHFLSARHHRDGFQLADDDLEIVLAYYPESIIEDARHNPATKHTTVRALLAPEVHVKLHRR